MYLYLQKQTQSALGLRHIYEVKSPPNTWKGLCNQYTVHKCHITPKG